MRSWPVPGLGARIAWHEIAGVEPVRIYLHGLGCAAVDLFPVAADPALAGHRSLLIDLLGFGFSDRPDGFGYRLGDHVSVLAPLLEHERVAACEVIGHSMGGTIAVLLAAARPDLVTRIAVAEPCRRAGAACSAAGSPSRRNTIT